MKTATKKTKSTFRGNGVFLNEHDPRDIYVTSLPQFQAVSATVLPDEFLPDQSHLTVYDQGALGTCVAHQIATEKQDQEYREIGKTLEFSRRYLYALARKDCGLPDNNQGLFPRVADKTLCEKGIALSETVPETTQNHAEYVAMPINEEIINDAKKYRVSDNFAFVGVTESEIKQSLITFKGIGCSLPYSPKWWNFLKNNELGTPTGEGIEGWHRIRLNGYKVVNGKLKIRFQNSWSKSFGKNGQAFFDFDAFKPFMRDLSVYTDVPNNLLEKAKTTNYVFKTDLKRGMRGYEVQQLQKRLIKEGLFPYTADGIFGPRTEKAVKDYQTKNNITPVSGIVGPKTRAKLNGTSSILEIKTKRTLVDALIIVESNGNDFAVGDLNLKDKAYGCLQIRQPVCDDINRAFGTSYKADQMLGNRELSIWVFNKYMELWATKQNVGGDVTDEHRARIWNGGPKGYKKTATVAYWEKAKKLLQ